MKIDLFITTEVFDRHGKLRYGRKRRSKSFVEAFLSIMLAQMDPDNNLAGVTDVTGTDRTIKDAALAFDCSAPAADATNGLLVGTDNTPVNASDYALVAKIANGVGSGQLTHAAVVYGSLTVSDPNVSFTIQRDFTNGSGATITVKEEGLYCLTKDSGDAARLFCAIRDVEATGVAVDDGENLRVTYTIQTST